MFGIGLFKILFFVAVGVAGWFMWRRWRRPVAPPGRPPQPRGPAPSASAELMVKCPRCGAYVAEQARRCDRADCPRPA